MRGITIEKYGEADVMKLEEFSLPKPGDGEVLVEIQAAGVNFVDIYQRKGLYKLPLPLRMGQEGAGIVKEAGPGVTEFKATDRVAWVGVYGSYATHNIIPVEKLVPLPAGLSFEDGAAALLQGMTAHYLTHSTYPLKSSDTCLIHAAAGGVGQLFCQMARLRGATVIGTTGTEEKAKLAREVGANHVILYAKEDFETEVKRLTNGKGVNAVYDSVGKDTFEKSLNCLAHRGFLVLFGQSSGPVPPFDAQILNTKGSLYLTRPTLAHYVETRTELLERANDLFSWMMEGKIRLRIDRKVPLDRAMDAHKAMESRETKGKILLMP